MVLPIISSFNIFFFIKSFQHFQVIIFLLFVDDIISIQGIIEHLSKENILLLERDNNSDLDQNIGFWIDFGSGFLQITVVLI